MCLLRTICAVRNTSQYTNGHIAFYYRVIRRSKPSEFKINLDFLHIWESGADPIDSFHRLKPWTLHYHFKNISSADYLHVFEPNNVYAAAGSRIGMVPLFEGIVNYDEIIQK